MGVIFNKAKVAAQDGVLSSRDVGQLISETLKDGVVSHAEIRDLKKLQSEMEAVLTPDAQQALRRFLDIGPQVFDGNLAGEIFGLDNSTGDKLESVGVSSVSDLLIKSKLPEDRKALALEARIDVAKLTSFVEQADLARVMGVGKQYAALLHGVGINNVNELSTQDPEVLRHKISNFLETPEGSDIASRRPSVRTVTKWVNNSKALPRMIRYVGDNSASFTKEAFGDLKDYQKAMLLWGSDVRVNGGAVFEHEDLTVSTPRRKPAAINNVINDIETSGVDGAFEHAELSDIERVKLGDDTLGYRMTFDVSGTEALDSETLGSMGVDPNSEMGIDPDMMSGVEGVVSVAVDKDGNILDTDYDVWPVDYE